MPKCAICAPANTDYSDGSTGIFWIYNAIVYNNKSSDYINSVSVLCECDFAVFEALWQSSAIQINTTCPHNKVEMTDFWKKD